MPAACRLGLGTVQFGLGYGITNTQGQVSVAAARAILDRAARAGIAVVDTARLYGESEVVLGKTLPGGHPWRIVTKTAKFHAVTDADAARHSVLHDAEASLAALGGRSRIHALLAHDADDLLGPVGDAIWAGMRRLKEQGLVARIGASIYTGDQIVKLLDRYDIEIVQVPYSAVDQRLAKSGMLGRLAARNIEVHARSAYLQGLLLQPAGRIPARFGPLQAAVERMTTAAAAAGLSQIEAALAAVLARPEIDHVIVGTTSVEELDATIRAAERAVAAAAVLPISEWSVDDERVLNPARWGELT